MIIIVVVVIIPQGNWEDQMVHWHAMALGETNMSWHEKNKLEKWILWKYGCSAIWSSNGFDIKMTSVKKWLEKWISKGSDVAPVYYT